MLLPGWFTLSAFLYLSFLLFNSVKKEEVLVILKHFLFFFFFEMSNVTILETSIVPYLE